MRSYQLTGGDDGCYGPCFGPVIADELFELPAEGGGHLVLALRGPMKIHGEVVEILAIRPRYVGDTLSTIRDQTTTVGVWRIVAGAEASARAGLSANNSEYWAVGTSAPL